MQLAQLASAYQEFKKLGAELISVAAQTPKGLMGDVEKYTAKTKLPFPLLLDTGRAACKAYGVHHLIGLDALNIARPSAFIIDRDGKIRFIFVSRSQKERVEIGELLEVLKKL
ncbi:MAG: peroxiredoxin family protein [Acidobacteria bacterium]|nr:peroxiredoxin family protein [Acidobacteriota bacterium]MBI3656191.1 peroxiredoxin family protein [Acidobacteriota bacterium]